MDIRSKEDLWVFLKTIPSAAVEDIEICKVRGERGYLEEEDFSALPNGFHCVLRCNIKQGEPCGSTYRDVTDAWMQKLESYTATNWIIDHSSAGRRSHQKFKTGKIKNPDCFYNETYKCQLSSLNKLSPEKRKIDSRTGATREGCRNMKCDEGYIRFKVLNIEKWKDRDGYYLGRDKPLQHVIEMHFVHNHQLYTKATLSLSRVPSSEKEVLKQLFRDSYTPAEALKQRRGLALNQGSVELDVVTANKLPTINAVKHIHRKFKQENWGDKTGLCRIKCHAKKRRVNPSICSSSLVAPSVSPPPSPTFTPMTSLVAPSVSPPPSLTFTPMTNEHMAEQVADAAMQSIHKYYNINDPNQVKLMQRFIKCFRSIESSKQLSQKIAQFTMSKDSLTAHINVRRSAPSRSKPKTKQRAQKII